MRDLNVLRHQLWQLGAGRISLQRSEVVELARMLDDNETLEAVVFGSFESGFGMMAATNRRLLLINRSFLRTHFDDIAYHHITDIEINTHMLRNGVRVCTRADKEIQFKWVKRSQLYRFARAVEQRVHAAEKQEETFLAKGLNSPATS